MEVLDIVSVSLVNQKNISRVLYNMLKVMRWVAGAADEIKLFWEVISIISRLMLVV